MPVKIFALLSHRDSITVLVIFDWLPLDFVENNSFNRLANIGFWGGKGRGGLEGLNISSIYGSPNSSQFLEPLHNTISLSSQFHRTSPQCYIVPSISIPGTNYSFMEPLHNTSSLSFRFHLNLGTWRLDVNDWMTLFNAIVGGSSFLIISQQRKKHFTISFGTS